MPDLPDSTFFSIERSGAVVELQLNRPDKANGMTPEFWRELPALVQHFDDDSSVRALVLTGAGKHFSGGMDLATFQGVNELFRNEPGRAAYALRKLIVSLQDTVSAVEQTRLPVIAAIHGACLGAALDLVSACDIRLASRDALFAIEEVNIGMAADVGSLQRLPKLMSLGVVMDLAMTGRRFSGEEAERWGLIRSLHADRAAARVAALDLAEEIANKSPLAIAGIKRAVVYASEHTVREGLEQIATWNAGMLRPEDLMGALKARMSKTEAKFADLLSTG